MKAIIKKLIDFFAYKEPSCKICKDCKQIEVLVMGTDTVWVECPYCINKNNNEITQKNNTIL